MTPAPTCSVCDHQDRQEIDAALTRGEPLRSLASSYGVSRAALSRHSRNHLTPSLGSASASESREEDESRDPARSSLERVEELYGVARHLMAIAFRDKRSGLTISAMRELRQVIELLARVTGELDTGPKIQVNVLASPEWQVLRRVIDAALAEHPAARIALARALEEHQARELPAASEEERADG